MESSFTIFASTQEESDSCFSSLGSFCFPGDRIAIVPDKKIAKKETVLVKLITEILKHGISESDIVLVLTEQEFQEKESVIRVKLQERISEQAAKSIQIIAHLPNDRRAIALLGANRQGEPIGFCREIIDADLVIPIGEKPSSTRWGLFSGLFPRFGDQETQMRFAEAESQKMSPHIKKRLTAEIDEAVRLLGVVLSIQHCGTDWTVFVRN